MNYTQLFYWLVVADNARTFFTTFSIIFTVIAIIATLMFIIGRSDYDWNNISDAGKAGKKFMFWSYPFMVLFWGLLIFTPNKKDALLIIAGGQTLNYLTTDSVARQLPSELTGFLVAEIRNLAQESGVELLTNTYKQQVLESAKTMTTQELIDKMQVDTTFAHIVLNK